MPVKPKPKAKRKTRSKARSSSVAKRARSDKTPTSTRIVDAFRFLLDELGFAVTRRGDDQREVDVTFERPPIRVSVNVEYGSSISVMIRDLAARGDGIGLWAAVEDRCPDERGRLAGTAPLTEKLAAHADLLRRCAADLLVGDPTRVRRLRELQVERRRLYNRTRFGTSTGESPRFASRPTLEALFAVGPTDARVYQAVWDYAYAHDDIADFLNVPVQEVQRMLDRWDGLD